MGNLHSTVSTTQARNVLGQFAKNKILAQRVNERQAAAFQTQLGATIQRKILNKEWSSGTLVRAHRAQENITATPNAWYVGREKWLDKAAARDRGFTYWKMIEFGSTRNVGRSIKVAIGKTRFSGPRSTAFRSFARGEPRAAFGTTNGVRWKRVIITKPMVAQYAYRETFDKGNWGERTAREFEQILSRTMKSLVKVNATPV
jgi:Zn-dependent protease with chaperone function